MFDAHGDSQFALPAILLGASATNGARLEAAQILRVPLTNVARVE